MNISQYVKLSNSSGMIWKGTYGDFLNTLPGENLLVNRGLTKDAADCLATNGCYYFAGHIGNLCLAIATPPVAVPDFRVEYYGSICLVRPLTSACKHWLEANVGDDCQHWGRALVVEPCFTANLIDGLTSAGLTQ